jgi:hypothetical protein
VLIPVESAIKTRKEVRPARKTGRARMGFDAMFNSSRQTQAWSAGGRAPRKFADMSRQSKVVAMGGMTLAKNAGTAFGVLEEPIKRCVVPA